MQWPKFTSSTDIDVDAQAFVARDANINSKLLQCMVLCSCMNSGCTPGCTPKAKAQIQTFRPEIVQSKANFIVIKKVINSRFFDAVDCVCVCVCMCAYECVYVYVCMYVYVCVYVLYWFLPVKDCDLLLLYKHIHFIVPREAFKQYNRVNKK